MNAPYLVLARKYRPQRFADLTGQEHVVRTLQNALRTGRVAHAYLFTGPRGCGKTTSARILAKALNCRGRGEALDPCGTCPSCTEIAAGNDVDVQEIDAASNNGVDDVRQLREAARYLPARDPYKIYIIDEVHMLSTAAFNALLKTLEEPPGHIKFLLATTDPQKLPATILSRVQRHNIQLVPLGKIATRLREIAVAEGLKASDGALALVARQAAGSMRDALSLLDQLFAAHDPAAGEITESLAADVLGALDRGVLGEIVAAVLRRDAGAAMGGVVRAYEAGADFKRMAEELAAHARNLVLAKLPGMKLDLPDHEQRALAQEAAAYELPQLARTFELFQKAQDEVAKAASPRLSLEVAVLRAVHLAPAGSLPELLARVEQLAARTGAAPALPGGGSASPGGPRAAAAQVSALVPAASRIARPSQAAPPAPEARPSIAPEPAAPGRPLPGAESNAPIAQRFRVLVESVRAARKVGAAAVLEHAVPVEIREGAVVIGFKKGDARGAMLMDKDTRGAIEAAFERALGHKAALQLVELAADAAQPAASLADEREKARSERSAQRVAMGREHPAVRSAVELLGGEVEDVKDLGEG